MSTNHLGDLENGNLNTEKEHNAAPAQEETLDEYTGLVRYISTYQGKGQAAHVEEEEDKPAKKHWWSRAGVGGGGENFETPDDWLNTDMKQGLRSTDVEPRRKKTGWNELTTEKENMFIKFLSFFTGPILYGQYPPLQFSHV